MGRRAAIFAFSFAAAVFLCAFLPDGRVLSVLEVCLTLGIIALCAFFAVFFLKKVPRPIVAVALCGLSLGFIFFWGFSQLFYAPATALAGSELDFTATVQAYPEQTDYGQSVETRLEGVGANARVLLYLDRNLTLSPGDRISARAVLELPRAREGFDALEYYRSRGIFLTARRLADIRVDASGGWSLLYLPQYITRAVKTHIDALFSGQDAALLRSIILGDKSLLSPGLSAALKGAGLSHVVAVSGMHISFLVGMITLLFGRKRRVALIILPAVFLFAAVAGFTPSVMRAAIMQCFVILGPLLGRESDRVTSLAAALFLVLALNPFSACGLSLILSFSSTLGIILFSQKLNTRMLLCLPAGKSGKYNPVFTFVSASFATTLGALVFTTPLTMLYFSTVYPGAPISNLLAVPAVSLAFTSGVFTLIVSFIAFPAAAPAAALAALPLRYLQSVLPFLSKLPLMSYSTSNPTACAWVIFIYALAAGFVLIKSEKRDVLIPCSLAGVTLCVTVLFAAFSPASTAQSICVLDVGQGQCIVVTSESFTAIIDCGGSRYPGAGAIAADYIRSLGRGRVDLLMLTHYHDDHAGGVEQLFGLIDVGRVALPSVEGGEARDRILELASKNGAEIIMIGNETTFSLGSARIDAIPPLGLDTENEMGVCALISLGESTGLVTGDLGEASERMLVKYYDIPKLSLLVAGHHGSRYSSCQDFLDVLSPKYAAVSVGENTFGHPSEETLDRLGQSGAQIFRTDLSGNIVFRFYGDSGVDYGTESG